MTIIDRMLTLGVNHGRSGRKMTPQGIVIHYVGNPGSTAEANRNWFESGSSGTHVSSHYIIGLDGEVLQCLPDDECGAHAGKAYAEQYKEMAKTNNSRFIGIECCHPASDGKYNEFTYKSLIELCANLCRKYNLAPEKDVYSHHGVSGKNCPCYYVKNPDAWRQIINDIAAQGLPILALPSASLAQMQTWAQNKNAKTFFVDLASTFYSVSAFAGVDPVVTYCQSALETGFGHFTGIIDASFYNTCGMKTKTGGSDTEKTSYMRFGSWEEGILAQVDHLALYAGAPGYPKGDTPDPRHFVSLYGKTRSVQGLTGTWANDLAYGEKILQMIDEVKVLPEPSIPNDTRETISDLSVWAREAWEWAVRNSICDGNRPQEGATREEVVTMMWRAANLFGKLQV